MYETQPTAPSPEGRAFPPDEPMKAPTSPYATAQGSVEGEISALVGEVQTLDEVLAALRQRLLPVLFLEDATTVPADLRPGVKEPDQTCEVVGFAYYTARRINATADEVHRLADQVRGIIGALQV